MDASSRPRGSHEDPGQVSIIEGGGNEVGGPNVFIHLRSNVGLRGAPTEKGVRLCFQHLVQCLLKLCSTDDQQMSYIFNSCTTLSQVPEST